MVIAAATLLDYIPHRSPMIWIDSLTEASDDGGTAITVLKADGSYLTNGQLRRSACMEFVAQAYAFTTAAQLLRQRAPVDPNRRALLAAIKEFKIVEWPTFEMGSELRTEVKKTRQLGPISVITGTISFKGRQIATGELKVFSG